MAAPAAGAGVAAGERLIGVRLGGAVTRTAPWRITDQEPELGWLTGSRRLPAGRPVPGQLATPQAVPHLAFLLGAPLTGPGVSAAAALAAVASVHAAIELADGVAGAATDSGPGAATTPVVGALAARDGGPAPADGWFLVSPAGRNPAGLDLALEACLVEVDGQVTDSGTGAAAAGHPAEALAWAANALDAQGLALEPGWLVLSGPLTAPVPLRSARSPAGAPLAVHFTTLGSLFLPPG
jgi:2-oxo-3-hexenedioate decarboxylase